MIDSKVICDFPAWRIIPGLGYVVTNHGNCKSPRPEQCGTPSKCPSLYGLINGGFLDPNCPYHAMGSHPPGGSSPILPCYLTSSTLPLVFPVEAPRSPGGAPTTSDVVSNVEQKRHTNRQRNKNQGKFLLAKMFDFYHASCGGYLISRFLIGFS